MSGSLRTVGSRLAILLPLIAATILSARTINRESCTVDEFGNLPLTVVYWSDRALHIDPGNPPLTRWVQGVPLLPERPDPGVSSEELLGYRSSWDLGYVFEAEHFDDYARLLTKARWGSVFFFLLAVAGVFVWARGLAGTGAALGASLLTAFSPNLIAHGRLVTPDAGIAALVVWAGWATWRSIRADSPGGARAVTAVAGALAGAAVLSKFSGLLLLPALPIAILIAAPGTRRKIEGALLLAAVAGLVVFAGYGFPGFGKWGSVPVPLPAPLMEGILAQMAEPPYPSYLLGETRIGGWLRYYPIAFLVKVPSGTIALALLAILAIVRERQRRFALPLLLAVAFFVALSLVTKKNVGIRYLLPAFPLLHVAIAAVFASSHSRWRRVGRVLLLLAGISGVSASAAPLAYFNGAERFLGGKRATLVDSNLDWGQALPDLRDWAEREGVEVVQLAYFGRIDPSVYGIRWRTLKSVPVRGAVAISATLAVGRPYVVRVKERPMMTESALGWSDAESWAWLNDLPPDEELGGGAILVWKDAEATRKRVEAERAAAAATAGAAAPGDGEKETP